MDTEESNSIQTDPESENSVQEKIDVNNNESNDSNQIDLKSKNSNKDDSNQDNLKQDNLNQDNSSKDDPESKDSIQEENNLNEESKELKDKSIKDVKSKNKTGVVYLSKIPAGRNYTRIREIFEKFARIGNIYLVPDKQANDKLQKKGKTYKFYKEGFVEFKRKKDAKNFTKIFNGQTLKNSGADGFIWDLKYLHRVKWHHVMAKFKHNKAIEEQRLRLETEKARESADHYLEMVNEWKKRGKREFVSDNRERIEMALSKKQRKTKDELKKKEEKDEQMNELYEKIFG